MGHYFFYIWCSYIFSLESQLRCKKNAFQSVNYALFMFDVQCTKEAQCEGGGKSSYLVELLLEELLLRLKRRKSS